MFKNIVLFLKRPSAVRLVISLVVSFIVYLAIGGDYRLRALITVFSFVTTYGVVLAIYFENTQQNWEDFRTRGISQFKELDPLFKHKHFERVLILKELHDNNLLYQSFLRKEIDERLEYVQRGKFIVVDHKFDENKTVIDLCKSGKHSYYRCVWTIEKGEILFDDSIWKSFFEKISTENRSGNIPSIKMILALSSQLDPDCDPLNYLFEYFDQERKYGMECKHISTKIYKSQKEKCLKGQDITNYHEFGIYGDSVLFGLTDWGKRLSKKDKDLQEIYNEGEFSINHGILETYTSLFEDLWVKGSNYRRRIGQEAMVFDDVNTLFDKVECPIRNKRCGKNGRK